MCLTNLYSSINYLVNISLIYSNFPIFRSFCQYIDFAVCQSYRSNVTLVFDAGDPLVFNHICKLDTVIAKFTFGLHFDVDHGIISRMVITLRLGLCYVQFHSGE